MNEPILRAIDAPSIEVVVATGYGVVVVRRIEDLSLLELHDGSILAQVTVEGERPKLSIPADSTVVRLRRNLAGGQDLENDFIVQDMLDPLIDPLNVTTVIVVVHAAHASIRCSFIFSPALTSARCQPAST